MLRDSRGPLTEKYGFSVVAPIRVSSPSSTDGSRASCCARLKRCTSSRNKTVRRPCSPRRALAPATVSLTSFTPAETADRPTNARLVAPAMRRAKVVLPVPGGPQSTAELSRSASMSARRGRPGASRCSCPTISSRLCGRIRAASGPSVARRRSSAAWKRSAVKPAPGRRCRPRAGRGRRRRHCRCA